MNTMPKGSVEGSDLEFSSDRHQRESQPQIEVAENSANMPSATVKRQIESWAEIDAASRMMNSPKATFRKIIGPHCERTKLSCVSGDVKLILCDAATLDFLDLTGFNRSSRTSRGKDPDLFLFTALMLDASTHSVDGVVAAEVFHHTTLRAGKTLKRRRNDRESEAWGHVFESVGRPPEGVEWVTVFDQGADDLDAMWRAVDQGLGFVIPASDLKRKVITPGSITLPLRDYLETLSPHGTREVRVPGNCKTPTRTATLTLRFGEVSIPLPSDLTPWLKGHTPVQPLQVGVVELVELTPPEDVRPVRLVLYTHVRTRTSDEANVTIERYEQLPVINYFHKGVKVRCQQEIRGDEFSEDLKIPIGVILVTALRILQIKTVGLQNPDQPARELVPVEWIQMVQRRLKKPVDSEITIYRFFHLLARCGGFLGRKHDGEPGWSPIWYGFERIESMLYGQSMYKIHG